MLDLMKNDKLEVRINKHLEYLKAKNTKAEVIQKVKTDNDKAVKAMGKKDASLIRGLLVR